MKKPIDSGPIWTAWTQGHFLAGPGSRAHVRVTVEPGFLVQFSSVAGNYKKVPVRWWQRASNSQVEVEIPNLRTMSAQFTVDADAGTATFEFANTRLNADHVGDPNSTDLGQPGFLTPGRGVNKAGQPVANRWNYTPNEWQGMLGVNALLRVYEGFGGHGKTMGQALADGNLVHSGTWMIDDTPVQTGNKLTVKCRNMAKLLIDQECYTPAVPAAYYPLSYNRLGPTLNYPVEIYGAATNPRIKIVGIEGDGQTQGYWLVGDDGGIYTYGLLQFYGCPDGSALVAGGGAKAVIGLACEPAKRGYWVGLANGQTIAYGNAVNYRCNNPNPIAGIGGAGQPTVVAIETAGNRGGYWLAFSDGRVAHYGYAPDLGGSRAVPLIAGNKIAGMASTPDGGGYWLCDQQGHVYAIGNATYYGGVTQTLIQPVTGMKATPSGHGYIICAGDGGAFCFGDAHYAGSMSGQRLNDPMTDVLIAPDDSGYWLAAEDGGVFTYGAVQFYGSLPGTFNFPTQGNYNDFTDVIRDICMWAGFYFNDGGATGNVFGVLETTGTYSTNLLDSTMFDKLPFIDGINKIRDIVGYLFTVDDEGAIIWRDQNFWQSGNYLPDGSRTLSTPVIDERTQLTDYTLSTPGSEMRSSIIISNSDPELGLSNTLTTTFVPPSVPEMRGMLRPAMWVNEAYLSLPEQNITAQLIWQQMQFKSRLGSVVCLANPMIQVDDQVIIIERETFERNIHYVRQIDRSFDAATGKYTMTLTTNYLSGPDGFEVRKPVGGPTGTSSIIARPTSPPNIA